MMRNEKSGGHSERSVGIGTIEVAVWDAVAKIADKPLHRVLAERYSGGKCPDKVFVYVGGGWYEPGKGRKELQDEMRRHLDAGYTMVKMKVGGAPLDEDVARLEAVKQILPSGAQLAVDANSKFDRDDALAYAKALAPFGLRWFEEPCDPLDFALLAEIAAHYAPPLATGENLFSTQDVENLVRFGGLKPAAQRRHPDRSAAGLRHRPIRPHRRDAGKTRLAALVPVPARRQPDVARHCRRLRAGRRGILSGRVRRVWRLCRRCAGRERLHQPVRPARHRL